MTHSHDNSSDGTIPDPLRIVDGVCWVYFALDVGHAIDLDHAQRMLDSAKGGSAKREELKHRRQSPPHPQHVQFRPAPLSIEQAAPELSTLELGDRRVKASVKCTLYDFGAVSVAYQIDLADRGGSSAAAVGVSIASLSPLGRALFDCAPLRDDAVARVRALVSRLGEAIDRQEISPLVEDYSVYHARRWRGGESSSEPGGGSAVRAITQDARAVATLLLAESDTSALSQQSIDSVLDAALAYSDSDAAIVNWNAALVLGTDEDDTLAVLEFANVELLEMRLLDDRLDAVLDESYGSLLKRDARGRVVGGSAGRTSRSPLGLLFDPHKPQRERLAAMQMESAVLFEGVNNALKLVGDQHLARVYAVATTRFHLADWDRSILRKLNTIESLYEKLADEQGTRRMEILEWIIIVLIAVSTILPFVVNVGK